MNVPWFCLGLTAGIGGASLLWVLYICWFPEEAVALGGRIREWFRRLLRLPPVVK